MFNPTADYCKGHGWGLLQRTLKFFLCLSKVILLVVLVTFLSEIFYILYHSYQQVLEVSLKSFVLLILLVE